MSLMDAKIRGNLTVRMAMNLAAPHTWPAAIMPALLATCVVVADTGQLSVTMTLCLLLIVILMQSAVNTFNDYYDFVKGNDSEEDNVEASDSVLVYNDVDPHDAKQLAIGFLVVAFLLGIYAIVVAGWIPLVIALVGAVFVVLYSAGKSPISYLPVGEFVSGIVMGGLIPLACYDVLAQMFDIKMLLFAVPTIIGVGLIMATNNTCDIERDEPVGRRTLAVILGRGTARGWYHVAMLAWILSIVLIVCFAYSGGIILLPFMLLATYPLVKALWMNPLTANMRLQAMPQVLSLNIALGAFYCAAILMSAASVAFTI